MPAAIIELGERMEIMSSCLLNGGMQITDTVAIFQVPFDYDCSDPIDDAKNNLSRLGLPADTACFMTAAEVDCVLSKRRCDHKGFGCLAVTTAGLGNHVIAGDELVDFENKRKLFGNRNGDRFKFRPGTINTVGIVSRPLSDSAKINTLIAMVEAKSAAMGDLGFKETGTTSDSIALICPAEGERDVFSGTGYGFGLSLAKAVRAAVRESIIKRGNFPPDMSEKKKKELEAMYL